MAEETEMFSGADLEGLCREAALAALLQKGMEAKEVTIGDFRRVLKTLKPSVTRDMVESFKKLRL